METICITLAGKTIRLDSPEPLEIGEALREFCIPMPERTDGRIGIGIVPRLPEPRGGIRFDGRQFEAAPHGTRIFHRGRADEEPYAMVEYGAGRQVRVLLRREFADTGLRSYVLLNLLCLEQLLLELDALMLHASFVRFEGRGILFSGPSGIGKSTQARLWETFRGAQTLNGDRAAIRCADGQWRAYGLPLAGSSRIFRNESAPIGAIVVLRQAPRNHIRPMSPAEAIRALLPEFSIHRWDREFLDRVLDLSTALLTAVPVYLLECTPEESAVELLQRTIEKGGAI